jgi:RNA-directed DNA polymerase
VERAKRRRHGQPNFKLTRYADDWCLMVHGTYADSAGLRDRIAGVLATMGLRLSPEKTLITHIDEGLDFLGWRIQRHRKRGTGKKYVLHLPGRSRSISAGRCASAGPMAPARTGPARIRGAGWKKRTLPS